MSSIIKRLGLIALTVAACTLSIRQARAWNGALQGQLSVSQSISVTPTPQGIQVMGSGRVSDEDGLSLIGTVSLPQREGLSLISVRVDAEHFNQRVSLPGQGRLVTYQERDAEGHLTLSASAYQGWVEVHEFEGYATVHFELSVRLGEEVRSLLSQGDHGLSLRSSDPQASGDDDAVDTSGEVIIGITDEELDEGCDEGDEDLYHTEEDVSCDNEPDDWSAEEEPWDSEEDSSDSSDSSDSCEEDDWAAEASVRGPVKRRRPPYPMRLLTRLAPVWCSLLFIYIWRRRALRLRCPKPSR